MFKAIKRVKFREFAPKTYKRLRRKAKYLARKNSTTVELEEARLAMDFLSSAWMELRFAVRPLVISAEDAIKLHNEGLKAKKERFSVTRTEYGFHKHSAYDVKVEGNVRSVTVTKWDTKRKATAGVILKPDTSLATMRELGFTNLAGTAWELTFLSWAIGYFVDVSGLLYYMTPNVGISPLAAWSTTKDSITAVTNVKRYDATTGIHLDTAEYTATKEVYHRHPIDGPGFLEIAIDIDLHKAIDLIALLNGVQRSMQTKNLRI
jgi:hypothetical protein